MLIAAGYFHRIFPTKAVLLSPLFLVIGGGNRVLSATMYSIVVDVSPVHMRFVAHLTSLRLPRRLMNITRRTTIFYVIGAGILMTDIVMLPIGSWLLSKDLWLPFKFSLPIMALAFPVILGMPETIALTKPTFTDAVAQTETSAGIVTQVCMLRPLEAPSISKFEGWPG